MHRFGIIGLSYRHASTEHIAGFTWSKERAAAQLSEVRAALGVTELVYLATCNRVEWIFAMPGKLSAKDCRAEIFRTFLGREAQGDEARQLLRAWAGEAAAEHLLLLACGLDSAQAGEREIALQLRQAWNLARSAGVSGPRLDYLLGESLAMANRVQDIAAQSRAPSLADLAVQQIQQHLDGRAATVALLGVSPMTRRCAEQLSALHVPLLIINRSLPVAEERVAELQQSGFTAQAQSLQMFLDAPIAVGGLVAAAGGACLLDAAAVKQIAQVAQFPPLMIDFGVPSNIDPQAAKTHHLQYCGMDDLIQLAQQQRLTQLLRLAPVRAAIDERLSKLRKQLAARNIGADLAGLRESFENIACEEMTQFLSQELSELSAEQKALLERFATVLARQLAHIPLSGIRAIADQVDPDVLALLFQEAQLKRGAVKSQ
jgi:glutamyl-tRNA reductase